MTNPFSRAPHQGGRESLPAAAPNAALLIDFDNVTMGMRSDLSKEMKSLLGSDVIRGKVTVQRAYADWRRYPQYIVPLSESSIDLIFAPAYGSNKKNATDIRMAIDGMELVFTRPEIGTYILLTGDSDFSSLVLKLKEYGKYVIGVGIQESSSDILVQNCDEYYSYTNLSGLRKTTESDRDPVDPWVLVEKAIQRMAERNDVMRSDRLKQVMLEIDAGFDEGAFGFSKFSRFVTEASSKGLLKLKKMDNGQYEVAPTDGRRGGGRSEAAPSREREERGGRGGRNGGRGRERGGRGRRDEESRQEARSAAPEPERPAAPVTSGDPLQNAYALLTKAVERLIEGRGAEAVRDSDVKRRMLEMEPGFDEAELGFTKFSRFLRQAHDHGVIILRKRETGNYEVALPSEAERSERAAGAASERGGAAASAPGGGAGGRPAAEADEAPPVLEGQGVPSDEVEVPVSSGGEQPDASGAAGRSEAEPEEPETLLGALGRRLGLRIGSSRRREEDGQPVPLEGQAVEPPSKPTTGEPKGGREKASARAVAAHGQDRPASERPEARPERTAAAGGPSAAGVSSVDPSALGLPTDADAQVRYLANSYKGVGAKTAESLVEGFGEDLFTVLQEQPERVRDVIPPARAETVLDQWKADLERRQARMGEQDARQKEPSTSGRRSGGGGGGGSASRSRGSEGGSGRSGGRDETVSAETPSEGSGKSAETPSTPGAEPAGRPAGAGRAPSAEPAAAEAEATPGSTPSDERAGAGRGGGEGAEKPTRTVGGVEIPEDAEPSPLRGRRSGRRGR